MAKYQRRKHGSWTISSTLLGWGVTGAAVLLVGFFLTGLYIGYGMGMEEGKKQLREEIRTSGEQGQISDQIAELIDRQQSQAADTSATDRAERSNEPATVETDTPGSQVNGAFTEEDLGFSGEGEESKPASGAVDQSPSQDDVATSGSDGNGSEENSANDLYPGADEDTGSTDTSGEQTVDPNTEISPYDYDRSSDTEDLESFFTIQTVSFQRQDYAKRSADELRADGHSVTVNQTLVNDTTYYRVRVGVFTTRSQARKYADEMVDRGEIEDYWISKVQREN